MSNIATLVMEGYSGSSSINYGEPYEGIMVAEAEFSSAACATLYTDILEAERSWMVADVIGAATIVREQRLGNDIDTVAVSEGTFKDVIDKIVAAFKKFGNAVKEFFKKVLNWFRVLFMDGEKFVKEFGKELIEKSKKAKGFSYTGWKYDFTKGQSKLDDTVKKSDDSIEKYTKLINDTSIVTKEDVLAKMKVDFTGDDPVSAATAAKKIYDLKDDEDIQEYIEDLVEAYHSGESSKEIIEDFEAISVSQMIDFVKGYKKITDSLGKKQREMEKRISNIVKRLESIKVDDFGEAPDKKANPNAKDNRQSSVEVCQYTAKILSASLSYGQELNSTVVGIYKEASKQYIGVLKAFYRFRPAKESVEIPDPENYALLETSLFEGDDPNADDDDVPVADDSKSTTESLVSNILEQVGYLI